MLLALFALAASSFRRFVSRGVALSFNGVVRMMGPFTTCFDTVDLLRGYLLTGLFVLCFQQFVLFFELSYQGRLLRNVPFRFALSLF